MRPQLIFISGLAAGIAFIFACSHMNVGTDAHAAPTDCATWQAQFIDTSSQGFNGSGVLPAGWEPFASNDAGSGAFKGWMRRCVP